MIYIIIGQSGSGKTTFVKERFLTGEIEPFEDVIPCSKSGDYIAFGKYGIGIRTEGTDTLPYNAQEKIQQQIKRLKDCNLVLEGDRINSQATFRFIAALDIPVKMYLLTCRVSTSIKRLRSAGSKITVPFVKATKSKSRRSFLEFGEKFSGEIVDTEEGKNI